MSLDIFLDGGETAVIKAIGIGGGAMTGEHILDRAKGMDLYEAMDVCKGLIDLGYLICDRDTFSSTDDFRNAEFRVNSGYTKALRKAIDPEPQSAKPKRVRRE
jgi:hypothetical protein